MTVGPRIPTRVDNPTLPHPLLSWKSVHTVLGSVRGAITHNTTIKAKKPKTWRVSPIPSIIGSFLTKTVFQIIANVVMDILKRVECHPCIVYDGMFNAIKPWICWLVASAVVAIAACQPTTHIHPTI